MNMDNRILPVSEVSLEQLGILTKDTIRRYPLRYTNLQAVMKMYAVNTNQPFTMSIYGKKGVSTEYYLTDYGLEYVYDFFKGKDLTYAKALFNYLFTHSKEDTLDHLDTYSFFDNFRGTRGTKSRRGSKQPALIIRTVGRAEKRYEFNSIAEARDQLRLWVALYPIEQFTLYRIKTDKKGYKYKERIKLFPNY